MSEPTRQPKTATAAAKRKPQDGQRGPLKGQEGIGRPKAPVPVSKRPSWPEIFAVMEARQCTAGQALDCLLDG